MRPFAERRTVPEGKSKPERRVPPRGGIGFNGQIQRRLFQMRGRYPARGIFAIMPNPPLPQPRRSVELACVLFAENRSLVSIHSAQHGIDEARKVTRGSGALRLLHRKADCCVRRDLHESKLHRGGDEDETRLESIRGQRLFEKAAKNGFDLAQPAQGGRGDSAGESAVAKGKAGKGSLRARCREGFIEGLLVPQHRIQEMRCELPGQQP